MSSPTARRGIASFASAFFILSLTLFFAPGLIAPIYADAGKCSVTCRNGSCEAEGACTCTCSFWTGAPVCTCSGSEPTAPDPSSPGGEPVTT